MIQATTAMINKSTATFPALTVFHRLKMIPEDFSDVRIRAERDEALVGEIADCRAVDARETVEYLLDVEFFHQQIQPNLYVGSCPVPRVYKNTRRRS